MKQIITAVLLIASSVLAAPTGPPPGITAVHYVSPDPATYLGLEFVPIGYPSNNPDSTGFGSVPYEYEIAKYEVTEIQWNMFVEVASRPTGLPTDAHSPQNYWGYDNLPITLVSWYEIAQFCNWLTSGDKFSGAYQFDASGAFLGIDRDAALDLYDAVYAIPSEDEWYKAAYFKPDASGYSLYAHGLDTDPVAGVDAVFDDTFPPDFDGVGSCNVEQNGTYDMMGLVFEWTESAWDGVLDDLSENRVVRGGILDEAVIYLRSTFRFYTAPEYEFDGIGFRVVRLTDPYIQIEIDIKPGSDVNPIHLGSKGRVPVAIFSDADFDASTIDPATIRFAHAPPIKYCLEDVDSDGDVDLKVHFMTANLEIDPADSEAMLMGQTYNGMLIVGMDTVKVISGPTR